MGGGFIYGNCNFFDGNFVGGNKGLGGGNNLCCKGKLVLFC